MTEEQREKNRLNARLWGQKPGNKEHMRLYRRQHYLENKEKYTEAHKKWKMENVAKAKKCQDNYTATHKEQKVRYDKQHYSENKERILEVQKQYYIKNKDKIDLKNKKYRMNNKEEVREMNKQYRINNKEQLSVQDRKSHLRVRFGITPERYNEMFANQEGRCAICGKHQKELKVVLAVDHNHITGEIRGLLCGSCNRGLGLFKDDHDLLQKALDYLRKDNKLRLVSGI